MAAVIDVKGDFGGVVGVRGKDRRHELDRVMRLQVAGLHRQHAVVRGMGFVETVVRELLPFLEDLLGGFFLNAVFLRAGDELDAVLLDFVFLFLGNGLAEVIGFGRGITGEVHCREHDLFLVDRDAVRLREDRLHQRVEVLDFLLAAHTGDVVRDELHRPRTVERDHGDNVLKLLRAHLHEVAGHARTFKLEDARRVAGREEFVCRLVIRRDVVEVELDAVPRLDHVAAFLHNGQRDQAEEVDLQQAHAVDDGHLELRDRLDRVVVGAVRRTVQRRVLNDGDIRDDQARRVRTGVAGDAFHLHGGIDELRQLRTGVHGFLELGDFLHDVFQGNRLAGLRHLGAARDQLADAVDIRQRHVHDAADIAHGGLRAEHGEGDDLRDVIRAVLIGAVLQQLVAFVILNVEVDIRHGDTARVQETLEDELEFQRLDRGNAEGVSDHGARAGTADVIPPVAFLRLVDEVLHDEEVGVEAHRVDDVQFLLEALAHHGIGGVLSVTPDQARFALLAQESLVVFAFRQREDRQMVAVRFEVDVAALRDLDGVLNRARDVAEELPHFFLGTHVVGVVVHAEALLVVEMRAGLNREEDILIAPVFRIDVMRIVRRDELRTEFVTEFEEDFVDLHKLRHVVILQLEEEVIRAEDVVIPRQAFARLVDIAFVNQLRNLARHTGGRADQPFRMGGEIFMIDAGMIVKTFQLGRRGDLEQVVVARLVLGKQQEVVGAFVARLAGVHIARGEVGFQPDDGMNARFLRGHVELHDPEHGAVVRNGNRGLIHLLGALHDFLDL